MKKIFLTLLLCFILCLGWCQTTSDSTVVYYNKDECKTIFLLTFEIIDNEEICDYPQNKIIKLRNVLCDCFALYNFISVESSVVKYYFKNINGYPLK